MTTAKTTVGDLVAAYLELLGVRCAFGVLSIHNMPLLDALSRRGSIRFVGSRGEAGAVNMADAAARVTGGLGVAFTSTGTGAGNAAGALIEARTAGTPLLHITGQVAVPYLDRNRSYVHEAPGQLEMLQAVSKAAFRVWSAETALGTLAEAARVALTAPTGPVSIEFPIDLQGAVLPMASLPELPVVAAVVPSAAAIQRLADRLAQARRPVLWVGGGARKARAQIARFVQMGFAVVTTLQGRGAWPEGGEATLGAFNSQPAVEQFYASCDAMLVVGSRLRVPETLTHSLKLPRPLYQVDVDPQAHNRAYPTDDFVCGDALLALDALADRLEGRMQVDRSVQADAVRARAAAEQVMRGATRPYDAVADAIQQAAGDDFNWVRDVTISNSTWGNRLLRLFQVERGVHATGGGIGQGLAMGIGAAVATPQRKTWVLVGDGGLALNLGELATAVQERTGLVLLVMNDGGYGILRNLQDADYGGNRCYADLHTPRFGLLAESMGMAYVGVRSLDALADTLAAAAANPAPATLVEFDMQAIGPFARPFTGPPLGRG